MCTWLEAQLASHPRALHVGLQKNPAWWALANAAYGHPDNPSGLVVYPLFSMPPSSSLASRSALAIEVLPEYPRKPLAKASSSTEDGNPRRGADNISNCRR